MDETSQRERRCQTLAERIKYIATQIRTNHDRLVDYITPQNPEDVRQILTPLQEDLYK